ncbi:integrase [Gossypium australe]|uniref:Integrase n=1 Tax=Gossypium australe TaxID=47621 RepID=A0A5B6VYG5_9ROSI|nr:integrase [Gossypium australe]
MIENHHSKENVVANALSRKLVGELRAMLMQLMEQRVQCNFALNDEEVICFYGRLCVPCNEEL